MMKVFSEHWTQNGEATLWKERDLKLSDPVASDMTVAPLNGNRQFNSNNKLKNVI